MSIHKHIAALTMVRNDDFFLRKWVEYYGRELGYADSFRLYLDDAAKKRRDKLLVSEEKHRNKGGRMSWCERTQTGVNSACSLSSLLDFDL